MTFLLNQMFFVNFHYYRTISYGSELCFVIVALSLSFTHTFIGDSFSPENLSLCDKLCR